MTTWVLEGELAVVLFVVLAPLLVVPFVAFVYRRYRYAPVVPTLLAVVSGLYACALVAFTAFPLPSESELVCAQQPLVDFWQLTPGGSIGDAVLRLRDAGAAGLTSGVVLQVVFNVALFVPLGFLLAYWARRSLGVALLAGLGASLLIEVSQGTGLWGLYLCPYRLADVDDLILNTSGALLGWALGRLVSRAWPFRDPVPRDDLTPPRLRRRIGAAAIDLVVVSVVSVVGQVVLVLGVELRGGSVEDLGAWPQVLVVTVGALLLGVWPLIRADRATPGQVTVLLSLRTVDGASAPAWSVLVRFLVRWLPILLWGNAVYVVLAVDGITAWRRSDHRSLTGVLSRTRAVTRASVARDED